MDVPIWIGSLSLRIAILIFTLLCYMLRVMSRWPRSAAAACTNGRRRANEIVHG